MPNFIAYLQTPVAPSLSKFSWLQEELKLKSAAAFYTRPALHF
jgi:hypothetical protein